MISSLFLPILIGIINFGQTISQESKGREHQSACGVNNIVSEDDIFIFSDIPASISQVQFSSSLGRAQEYPSESYYNNLGSRAYLHNPSLSYTEKTFESDRFQQEGLSSAPSDLFSKSYLNERFARIHQLPGLPSSLPTNIAQYSDPEQYKSLREHFPGNGLNIFRGVSTEFSDSQPSYPSSNVIEDVYFPSHSSINYETSHRFEGPGSHSGDATGDTIPKLFSEYFRKDDSDSDKGNRFGDNMAGGRNYNKKGAEVKAKDLDMFSLMNRVDIKKRKRRSIRERFALKRLSLKKDESEKQLKDESRCILKYSAGSRCQNLVVHIVSGDTSKMNCGHEFLRFTGDNDDKQYCGGARIRKTTIQGRQLSIEHFKKPGATGENFKGYVVCSYSRSP